MTDFPSERLFSFVISGKLFTLSWRILNNDAPNLFTHLISNQQYEISLDRDPQIFQDIIRHLQGYSITPKSHQHYVSLISDAVYYRFERLIQQLCSEYHFNVGGYNFQIERNFLREKDTPNFFTMIPEMFESAAILNKKQQEDHLNFSKSFLMNELDSNFNENIIPPPYQSPKFPRRNGENFRDLLTLLQGYEIDIRSPSHRRNLIRDAQYFHFRNLKERLQISEIIFLPDGLKEDGYFPISNEYKQFNQIQILGEDLRIGFIKVVSFQNIQDDINYEKRQKISNHLWSERIITMIFYQRTIDTLPSQLLIQTNTRMKMDENGQDFLRKLYIYDDILSQKLISIERKFSPLQTSILGIEESQESNAGIEKSQDESNNFKFHTFLIRYHPNVWIDLDTSSSMNTMINDKWKQLKYIDQGLWRLLIENINGKGKLILEPVKLQGWSSLRAFNEGRKFLNTSISPNQNSGLESRVVGLR